MSIEVILNLERKVSLYWVLLSLFLGGIGSVVLSGALMHVLAGGTKLGSVGYVLVKIASFPSQVNQVFTGANAQQLKDARFTNIDGFEKDGTVPKSVSDDTGYLLSSTYDASKSQATVQLIQINTQKVLHEWAPNITTLNSLNVLAEKFSEDYIAQTHFRLVNPLVVGDGLVFNSGSGLYGMDICSANNMFADGTYHHSNELDHEGNIWTPSVMYPHSFDQLANYRDDSLAKISPSGELLYNKSVAEILVENGYRGLFAGGQGVDRLHLNDIQPALTDTEFWLKGDLLVSLHSISTVMLYRPSNNKILWLQTGPWMNQHDMEFVDNQTISIFGNDQIDNGQERVLFNGHNSVYFYDFKTNQVSQPYREIMKRMNVATIAEGRGKPLPGGDLYIEESNSARLLRVSSDAVKWEYVRRIDKDTISLPSWSRYLTAMEASRLLRQIRNKSCEG